MIALALVFALPSNRDAQNYFEISTHFLQKIPHPKQAILQTALPTRFTTPCPQKHHAGTPIFQNP